ncbi:MAG: U32 family peptidase C-terminal domain-containing protein, partial [Saezia sp.]
DGLANRGYTEGFYDRHSNEETQNYTDGASSAYTQQYVASVLEYDKTTSLSTLEVRNRFFAGDTIEVIRPQALGGNHTIVLKELFDKNKQPIDVAPGSGHTVYANIGLTDNMSMLARVVTSE